MTPIFQPVPSLMLVGLEADLAEECTRAFPELLVLRVGHSAAAVERMLVTRPLVVVLGVAIEGTDGAVLECARDIQAEILRESSVSRAELAATVRASLLEAERNRERPVAPPATRL